MLCWAVLSRSLPITQSTHNPEYPQIKIWVLCARSLHILTIILLIDGIGICGLTPDELRQHRHTAVGVWSEVDDHLF